LRGVVSELISRGNEVHVFEPADGGSAAKLVAEAGTQALRGYMRAYPHMTSHMYLADSLDLDWALHGADLVLVHERSDPGIVQAIGRHRASRGKYVLLFHDTHHRCVSAPDELESYDLSEYDGVLAFSKSIRELYLNEGLSGRVWTWHEAADTRVFRPFPGREVDGDIVWIGNWGDDERTEELDEFLIRPVKKLGLKATVYGVRYPEDALQKMADAGIEYRGWLPNYQVPQVLAQHRLTVHVPRRFYSTLLPGTPTIRQFEAMACGIPLITACWNDTENLFNGDLDYLSVQTGDEMVHAIKCALDNPSSAHIRSTHALRTILSKHTCRHRVDELLEIIGATNEKQAMML
jgi:spore maturation protein CgeB